MTQIGLQKLAKMFTLRAHYIVETLQSICCGETGKLSAEDLSTVMTYIQKDMESVCAMDIKGGVCTLCAKKAEDRDPETWAAYLTAQRPTGV